MTEREDRGPNATSDALAGTRWEIVSIDGKPVAAGGEPLAVRFGHDGRVSGSTGVNHLTASYAVTAEYLTFGPLATSRRGGPPDLVEQEHRVLAALAGMCPLRLEPGTLTIDGPLGRVELVSTLPGPERPRRTRPLEAPSR